MAERKLKPRTRNLCEQNTLQ